MLLFCLIFQVEKTNSILHTYAYVLKCYAIGFLPPSLLVLQPITALLLPVFHTSHPVALSTAYCGINTVVRLPLDFPFTTLPLLQSLSALAYHCPSAGMPYHPAHSFVSSMLFHLSCIQLVTQLLHETPFSVPISRSHLPLHIICVPMFLLPQRLFAMSCVVEILRTLLT